MALILLPLYFLGLNIADPTEKALKSNAQLSIERSFSVDKSRRLSIEDIQHIPMQATPKTKIPWSFEQQAYWIKISFVNRTDDERPLVIHFDNPMLNQLTVYQFQQEVMQQKRELSWSDQQSSLLNRSILNYKFTLAANSQADIYSRIETIGIAKTPISIYSQEGFVPLIRSTYLIWGAFIGILCMISLYNLVLFYGLKERIFLIYIGYILSTLTMMSIVQGFGHYLFPSWLYSLLRANVISLNYLVLTFAVLFALFFLNYHHSREPIYRRSLYYVFLLFFLSILSVFISENIAAPIFFISMGIAYPLCFLLLYKNYNSENSGSVLYIVSWIPLLIGGAIQPLELTDVIPYSFVMRNIFGVCVVFEITLMAMALSERVRLQKEISLYNATHDLETGLPNYQILDKCLDDRIQVQEPITLCLISVTGLNRLSPYLSEQQSATLMEHFLHSTRGYVQPNTDFLSLVPGSNKPVKIARIRDNVFALVLQTHESHAAVINKLEPLSNCVNALLEMSGVSVNLKTSIGFYRVSGQHLTASAVMKKTFQALETGIRDGLVISGYDDQRHYSLTLASELREALSNDELMLFHQPQINPQAATVHGSEGLLRWKHKEHGFVPVDALIALAEDTGLINHVSLWVIDRACQDIRRLMSLGYKDHQVSVNISGSDVVDKKFLNNVQNILEKWQVPPQLLNLELTESVMISDYSSVKHVLEGLSKMGISVSIDDFGTGYSSLSHILELPFNELKIDRVFVTEMDTNQRHLDIVKTTIEMARILDLRVVAEGIETEAVAAELVACHCDLAQGYYYSKPLEFESYLEWLKHSATQLRSFSEKS